MNKTRLDILLIESDPAAADVVRDTMRDLPCRSSIQWASDDEALHSFIADLNFSCQRRPNLVILSCSKPGASPATVVKTIRSHSALLRTPILAMANPKHQTEPSALYRSGANAIVDKPTQNDDYAACLTDVALYWSQVARLP